MCDYMMKNIFHIHKYFTRNRCVISAGFKKQPNAEYLNGIKMNGLAF